MQGCMYAFSFKVVPPVQLCSCSFEKASYILLECVSLCNESCVVTDNSGKVLGTPEDLERVLSTRLKNREFHQPDLAFCLLLFTLLLRLILLPGSDALIEVLEHVLFPLTAIRRHGADGQEEHGQTPEAPAPPGPFSLTPSIALYLQSGANQMTEVKTYSK